MRVDAVVDGADAVVHLAWKFQPTHRPDETWATTFGARTVEVREELATGALELGWSPRHTAADAVSAFLSGAAQSAGSQLPPLHP